MITEDEESYIYSLPTEDDYEGRGEESNKTDEEPPITYHTLASLPLPNSMWVIRHIGSQRISILVDTGATHNFINSKVADELSIK